MTSNNNYVLNVSKQQFLSSDDNCQDDDCRHEAALNTDQIVLNSFIFSHMYTPDLHADSRAQCNLRTLAFGMIDDKHLELFNKRISNKFFNYTDKFGLNGPVYKKLPSDTCCHQYISDLTNIITCIKRLEALNQHNSKQINILIFYPFVKQLREKMDILINEFSCCKSLLNELLSYTNNLIAHCLIFVEKLDNLQKSFKVLHIFFDNTVVYECNICREFSSDQRFLKAQECCEFAICNACCVQLWKTAPIHAKCPSCNTSFK
jgi:hypothetical protein